MKDAYISGMDGVAIYVSTDKASYYVIRMEDDCARVSETSKASFQLMHRQLQDNPKMVYRRSIPRHEIINLLKSEHVHDQAIRLALMSVDPDEDAASRAESTACLESLLKTEADREWFAEHDPRT